MRPIIKFNNGRGAILCNHCHTILKEDLSKEEITGRTNLLLCDTCEQLPHIHEYHDWLILRENSANMNESGMMLCYCGHTNTCECAHPLLDNFVWALKQGHIKLGDPKNGWKDLR